MLQVQLQERTHSSTGKLQEILQEAPGNSDVDVETRVPTVALMTTWQVSQDDNIETHRDPTPICSRRLEILS